MSNETDLEWLARNVHKWHSNATHISRDSGFGHVFGWSTHMDNDCSRGYTKDQWLERRSELQNKPSWDKSGSEYTHVVQTADGNWAFAFEPEIRGSQILSNSFDFLGPEGFKGEVLGDWRDTLEQRPDMHKTTPEIDTSAERVQETAKSMRDWHERGERPPAGIRCEMLSDGKWLEVLIVGNGSDGGLVVEEDTNEFYSTYGCRFRPIRTERDQLVDALTKAGMGCMSHIAADAILAAGFSLRDK